MPELRRRRAWGSPTLDRGLPIPDSAAFGVPSPRVSVVISTYNRSNVLRHAIESVVAQSVDDWELLVVGDACTDDTADVVASFGDPRISFVNLPVNHGEQSGPNSIGARLARGRYLAWLNHDDMWLADHLESMVGVIEAEPADLVTCPWYVVGPHSDVDLVARRFTVGLCRPCAGRASDLIGEYPASSWLVRSDLVREVGDWGSGFSTRGYPSQDYLYRCWAAGARIRGTTRPTLVAIQSGLFSRAYRDRLVAEHDALAPLVVGRSSTSFPMAVLVGPPWPSVRVRASQARVRGELVRRVARVSVKQFVVRPTVPIVARLGLSPHAYLGLMTGRPAGGVIRRLRERRGLPLDP